MANIENTSHRPSQLDGVDGVPTFEDEPSDEVTIVDFKEERIRFDRDRYYLDDGDSDDPVKQYLDSIRERELLFADEEKRLFSTLLRGRVAEAMRALAGGAASVSVAGMVSENVAQIFLIENGLAGFVGFTYDESEKNNKRKDETHKTVSDFTFFATSDWDAKQKREILSEKEEKFAKWEQAGKVAQEDLTVANLRLVVSIAKKFVPRLGMSLLDFIDEGNIGLITAVSKFNPALGYKFSTYATWWIRQGITRAIGDQSRAIRVPVHLHDDILALGKVERKLEVEFGRPATAKELAMYMRIPEKKVIELRDVRDRVNGVSSLDKKDAKDDHEEASGLGDVVKSTYKSPEKEAIDVSRTDDIHEALARLTERERRVLELRFGLINDEEPLTLEEVGKKFGISKERVRQIEAKALRKLATGPQGEKLRVYVMDDPE